MKEAACRICGNPTELFYRGEPICLNCDKKRAGAAQEFAKSQTESTLNAEWEKRAKAK
jgi:uncharacterized Zn finger protein (UPF0148 family)